MTPRRLSVRSCRVIGPGDEVETHHTVQCPRRDQAIGFERCCGCSQMKSLDVAPDGKSGSVECVAEEATPHRARVDVAEAAVRVRLGDILGLDTTCVRGEVRVRAVTDLLVAQGLRAIPVVDASRRLIGIVSKTDLHRRKANGRRPQTAADIMTPIVHGLPEEAPVAYAISLMAFEGLHEVPIVDAKGHVLGMITSTDALRWVAQALGYVVPGQVDVSRSLR